MSRPSPELLERLLAGITYRRELSAFENHSELSELLEDDADGTTLEYLYGAIGRMPSETRGAVVAMVAGRLFELGDERRIRELLATDDASVQYFALFAFTGRPTASATLGPLVVSLAIAATRSVDARVRAATCVVIQNQCAWKVDVKNALEPLQRLLSDRVDSVRRAAAFALGHLAKHRYQVGPLLPDLRRTLVDSSVQVREGAAWAVAQFSRAKGDISSAVPELLQALQTPEAYYELLRAAAGALTHHAKKSTADRHQVRAELAKVTLDMTLKPVRKLVDEINAS